MWGCCYAAIIYLPVSTFPPAFTGTIVDLKVSTILSGDWPIGAGYKSAPPFYDLFLREPPRLTAPNFPFFV
jgi:hypothetical protein